MHCFAAGFLCRLHYGGLQVTFAAACRRNELFFRELQDMAVKIKQENWQHPDAWTDFDKKVLLLAADEDFVVHYEPFDPAGQQPCCLYVQRKEQQAWVQDCDPVILFMDSTHGTHGAASSAV